MEMVRMTEAELQQGFRALADRVRREPVTITTPAGTTPDGRDELVVLSAEEYARLKRRDRRVGLTEEWVEAVRNAKVPDEFAARDAELKWLARATARARSGPCHPL
jgi:PHD/YefM family antitoxin component YafN of YafNO toxin-antitoxin module